MIIRVGDNVPDCTVKTTWSETESLANVLQKQITFYFSLQSDLFNLILNNISDRYNMWTYQAYLVRHQVPPTRILLL